jgi:hypothetical protein
VSGFGYPDVEAGIVDQDNQVVAPHLEVLLERPEQTIVGSDLCDHLDQAEGRESLHPVPQRGSGLSHLRTAEGLDGGGGIPHPERANHACPVEIARRLASGDEDARCTPLDHQ